MTVQHRCLGFFVMVGTCAALACSGEKTETAPAATPGTAPAEAGGGPAPLPDAWQTSLPADFPADLPQYPGAEVTKVRSSASAGIAAGWVTSDEPAKVAAYFADALAAQGWATQRTDGPDGIMVFADKGDRSATYGVLPAEGKTQIDLLVVEMR